MISIVQLQQICTTQGGRARCPDFQPHLVEHAAAFAIDTPVRFAAFLGQVLHESAEFRYVRELGSDEYLSKYDTGRLAKRLGNTPERDGDGERYCGRGLIQITGRANYRRCAESMGLDLLSHPELLEEPEYAVTSAMWFWRSMGLNRLADDSLTDSGGSFRLITRRINGGYNGLDDRIKYWERARRVLGVDGNEEAR